MSTSLAPDPFAVARRYMTAPYARGSAVLELQLAQAAAGVADVRPYDFSSVQARYGLQAKDVVASYVLTLRADQLAGPAELDIAYTASSGAGTVHMVIPAGSLAGTSFALGPLPKDAVVLRKLTEHPVPASGQPSGPDKWALTALLGNVARLTWLTSGEAGVLAVTSRDVKAQHDLRTARGATLDRIGEGLGVTRLLPAPYRLDFDADTIALYHFDDAIAPVIDATREHPGISVGGGLGAQRNRPGKFGSGCQINPGFVVGAGLVIADALAFAIDPAAGFTVEMFVNLQAAPEAQDTYVLAAKRPHLDQSGTPGWLLAIEPSAAGHDLAFTLTDAAGTTVRAAANLSQPTGWFHVAGVVDPVAKQTRILLNGQAIATAPLGALGVVDTAADIGLGSDSSGAARLVGLLDEVRFSRVARSDFSQVLGSNAQPYTVDGQTIALYHLDEADNWIDEERGIYFAVNDGPHRGVPAHFGSGLLFLEAPLPQPRGASERDFQHRLRTGAWDRSAGGAVVRVSPYARFGYRQGAISEPGLDGTPQPVIVNDVVFPDTGQQFGLVTTAGYGFVPQDPNNPATGTDPSQTIAKFQAAGRSVQEAIDYFGEWRGLDEGYFITQYQAHGITAPHESGLSGAGATGWATILGSAEFTFDKSTSFTVECFIKPDAIADDYPRAIIAARSSGLRAGEANANEAGWALCVGTYHSIPNNLRWVVGDAAGGLVALHADIDLADGAFHHVAGVADRDLGAALLFVDGVEVAQAPLGTLGVVGVGSTTVPMYLGNNPSLNAPYVGLIDELRISRRARRQFRPVLGESDARYRQRLAIYQPRRIPAMPAIRRGVQTLTLSDPPLADVTRLLLGDAPLPGNLVQLDVNEADSTRFSASRSLRIVPDTLAPGQSIAADGTTPASEPPVAGLAPLPPDSQALLGQPDGANYTFATPQSRLMVLATARALERLATRLATVAPAARLRIQSAYLPAMTTGQTAPITNDNLGRALMLTLDPAASGGLDLGALGALAFAVGFAYVARQASLLRLVVAAGPDLELVVTGPSPGLDAASRQIAFVGQPILVSVNRPAPVVTNAQQLDWKVVAGGFAAGRIEPTGPALNIKSFTGTAAGFATIEVRYALPDGATALVGSMPIVIAPQTLATGSLGRDGTVNVTEAAQSGAPDADFRAEYLIASADSRVDYAATVPPAPASNLMQLPLEKALLRLAVLAAREPGAPRVTVLSAYNPGAGNLQTVGRGMVLAPSAGNLTAARLGVLAFLAGFTYVERRRYPPSVYASVALGDRFEIVSRPLRRLWPNAAISGRGAVMAAEFDAAGLPDPGFTPSQLQPFSDARATFAAGVSNLVQPSLASALKALLDLLAADGVTATLQVIAGYVPSDPTLLGVGRALRIHHPAVAADRLAGYALQAGFGFVQHRTLDAGGAAVHVSAYRSSGPPPNLLAGADANDRNLSVSLNTLTELAIRPQLGVKGRLGWDLRPVCPASAELSTALPDPSDKSGIAEKIFQGTRAGAVAAVATFSLSESSEPYQFLVLAAARSGNPPPQPRLSKDQYDDLLNFLDAHHPLGTEAVTKGLRGFVHGFRRPPRWDRLATAASFPRYRINK